MFITSREKSIIDLVMKTSGKHTPQSLASYLHVSVRTIQRDLKAVENILKSFELLLKRTTNDGLMIEGKNEHIFKLMQQLYYVHPTDETPEEKKLQLLIILLHEGSFFKIKVLAHQLGVSVTTLASYLDDLTSWLDKFTIDLSRKRGVGVSITGNEANKRRALATYLLFHFHEELLESLYILMKDMELEDSVLGYFPPDYLMIIDELVNRMFEKGKMRLADNDYLGLVVHIAITLKRVENNFLLDEPIGEIEEEETINAFQLMDQLCEELKSKLSIPLTERDVQYLAVILKGSKLQDSDTIAYDRIMLGQIINNIIQDVSSQLHVDLTRDFSLFQGLFAHMEPSIFRLKHQTGLFNPLTAQIKKKYPVLFMAVRNSLEKEIPEIRFPDDEVAFIVLHFGSALLMNEEKPTIHGVVVCPTGIGTSKMLASRIKKEFQEIDTIEVKTIKEMQQSNVDEFDIIISTVRLPFDEVHYILVSPLLSDEDIQMIRSYLQSNLQQFTGKKEYVKIRDKEMRQESSSLLDVLQEMKDVQTGIEAILNNLRIYRKSSPDYTCVLKEMVIELEQESLITDADVVFQKLLDREKMGGLGIPHTNMGLFHCRDDSIQELIFQICHLDNPCVIKGMDGKEVTLKHLLLMLSPDKLSIKEQEILSLISTSLIETDTALMIYSSSNEEMIRGKLEDLFSTYLQNKWIKE
ncbi:BglG family transcription antiterminator [Ornithinibacillus sp. JPR2-1]|uniref:BglG family transcription antiterminator n=1 Tax=Ornithinibacillus sp. JPR2-1 TaxID=2094019 RepID=UPI0031DD305E